MILIRLNRRAEGLALVAVLWAIVLLIMIVSVVAQNSRLDTRMCMADTEQLKCRWACKAAVESAIGMLNDDDKESDTLDDTWNVDSEDMTDVELDGCTFSFTITDEAGKLNINTAKKEHLLELPGMRQEIADAIVDWRDKDDTPSPAGAEASYYLNLRPGYEIRNSAFRTVRELLMVKGINEELLYGPTAAKMMQHDMDSEIGSGTEYGSDQGWIDYLTCYSYENNTDAQGDKRTNINKANEQELIKSLEITPGQAKWIVNNRKNNYKTIADILTEGQKADSGGNADANAAEPIYMDTFEKIIDKITIDDRRRQTGKVNINTADRVVLSALLEGDVALADNIIAYRSNLLTGMTSPADLMKVNSMTIERFKKIVSMVTTRSGVYSIHGTAKSSTTNCKMKIEVVVDRGRTPPSILYWRQGGVN